VQSAPISQVTLHVALPEQVTVHPPAGHFTSQVLFPWQVTAALLPTERLQMLVPSQPRLLPSPAERSQVLPPAQVEEQVAPQVRLHCDWPSQVLVQPVPHTPPQVFLELQS
jgi:hypothetical protein